MDRLQRLGSATLCVLSIPFPRGMSLTETSDVTTGKDTALKAGLCNAAGWDGLSPVCNTLGPK
jgi:hypothetical protein